MASKMVSNLSVPPCSIASRASAACSAEQAALAREAIEQGGTDKFDTIFEAITKSGALDHTLKCARQEAQAAANAISSFPDSIFKESLLELCSYSTARQS